jgi:5'-3' exoribonuclease 2
LDFLAVPTNSNAHRYYVLFAVLYRIIGNDFLPHLPSLDMRDGALDYLFNIYKRLLPTLGDYITDHGGEVNLSHVDVILAEVGAIEDFVFNMKHQNEENDKKRNEQFQKRKKHLTKNGQAPLANSNGGRMREDIPKVRGKAARILEQSGDMKALGKDANNENAKAAEELKKSLIKVEGTETEESITPLKRKAEEEADGEEVEAKLKDGNDDSIFETEISQDEMEIEEVDQAKLDEAKALLKQKMKDIEQKKLDDFAKSVDDKVRLHEKGWKVS